MADLILGRGGNFAAIVLGLVALTVIGLFLLFGRIRAGSKLRRSKLDVVEGKARQTAEERQVRTIGTGGATSPRSPETSPSENGDLAALAIQLRDANHALFMALMECCSLITEATKGMPEADIKTVMSATELLQSGRAAMSNREIANHAYDLANELRPFDGQVMTAVRRVLAQLALAQRWMRACAKLPVRIHSPRAMASIRLVEQRPSAFLRRLHDLDDVGIVLANSDAHRRARGGADGEGDGRLSVCLVDAHDVDLQHELVAEFDRLRVLRHARVSLTLFNLRWRSFRG